MLLLRFHRNKKVVDLFKCPINIRWNHYFVIPEIPNDTPESNPILQRDKIPHYNQLTAKNVLTGVLKQSIDFENEFNLLIKNSGVRNIGEFLTSIEKSYAPMDQTFKVARHLAYTNPYSQYMSAYISLQDTIKTRKNLRWSNKTFYEILRNKGLPSEGLSNEQEHIIKKYRTYCEINGLNLEERNYATLHDLNWKIHDEQNAFKKKLKYATDKFSFVINDKLLISELPKEIQRKMANGKANSENGPWIVTLEDDVYGAFMKNCSNQQIRKHLYENYNGRAAYLNETSFENNSTTIKNLLSLRNQKANLLGFKNYAEFSMKTRSAMKPENVTELLEALRSKLKPINEEEYETLQSYASQNGHAGKLNIYDIDYWKNRHLVELKGTAVDAQIMQYFPWKNVLSGTIQFCKDYLNINFVESKENRNYLWDENVVVYDVYENGNFLSTLLIDPFLRSGKIDNIWAYSGRDCSKSTDSKPIAHLVLNLKHVGQNTLMNFNQLKLFFNQFGKALQILLTQVEFSDSSDLSTFEFDGLSITSKVFERLLYVPEILTRLSSNINDGKPIPETLLKTIQQGRSYRFASFDLLKQSYLSAFDLECHITDSHSKFWVGIMEQLWPRYMPTQLLKNDFHPCHLVTIFGDSYGASFYSDLWSEMLAADIFEAFEEIGFQNDENIRASFKRFRETFLKNGSSLPTNETFRRFRGRNPSIQPFIEQNIY